MALKSPHVDSRGSVLLLPDNTTDIDVYFFGGTVAAPYGASCHPHRDGLIDSLSQVKDALGQPQV